MNGAGYAVKTQLETRLRTVRTVASRQLFDAAVVATASELFVENGFHATSMEDIADALCVTKPTVYEAYASKQDLFARVLEQAASELDLTWVEQAERHEISFASFLDRTPAEIMMLIASPSRFRLLPLLLQESALVRRLPDSFSKAIQSHLGARWDALIAAAMARGECRQMDPGLVRRMLTAPLAMLAFQFVALGETTPNPETTEAFLVQSYALLKVALLPDAG